MKKSINIQGMSSTSAYKDGECLQLVNLRKKNGVMKPVSPRKVTRTLAQQYSYTFMHNLPQTGENLIGVRNNNIYHVKSDNTETLLTGTTEFKSITQIGNLLNVVDGSGIKILFWVDTEYKVIETNFGGAQTDSTLLPVKVDLKVDGDVDANGVRKTRNFYTESAITVGSPYIDKQNICSGLIEKAIAYENKEGRLNGFFFACTAIELYDGNFILHSNPVLMCQEWDTKTRYGNAEIAGKDYLTNPAIYYYPNGGYDTVTSNIDGYYEKISNTTVSGTTYVGDGDSFITSFFPNLFCSNHFLKIDNGALTNRMVCHVSSNYLKFKINSNINEIYKPIIKSVSVFITKSVSLQDYSNVEFKGYFNFNGNEPNYSENYFAKPKTNAELLKELADNQQFYKVHEIPFDDIKTTTENDGWVTIDLKDKLGENLTMQEELTVDNFTHHNLIPAKQIAYNSKLHVMDYKQELFHGWPLSNMLYSGGIGQQPVSLASYDGDGYIAEVHIKTQNGISKVVRYKQAINGNTPEANATNAILSYPDSRATKIILSRAKKLNGVWNVETKEYKLTASDKHNFAYYINPDLKPNYSVWNFSQASTVPMTIPAEENRIQIYRNSMKVSSVNNPFYYPPEQTYTIGTGYIRAAGTNAMRMSEGQFGQYDLYILTSEGAYSFDTGTELAYNRQSPASLILPISDVVCSTPYGLVFVGERGAYLLNGQEAKLITPQLEQDAEQTSLFTTALSFTTFIKSLKDILFDNTKDELIFVGTTDYNYVLNVESGQFYLSTERVDMEVKNSMPMLVAEGMNLKDYSQAQSTKAHVSIITRPIYFGMDEVKQLHRAILRGRFYKLNTLSNSETTFLSLHGSNDGINHTLLRGWRMATDKQNRDYKDFDSGLFARATFRNYALKLEADIDESSEVQFIDFEVTDNYNNDKLR